MNEIRQLSVNKVTELSTAEKIDLMMFSHTTVAQTVFKLLELMVVEERDAAAAVELDKEAEQRAAWTSAHVMQKLYSKFRARVEESANEHRADIEKRALEEELKDQAKIQEIILHQ